MNIRLRPDGSLIFNSTKDLVDYREQLLQRAVHQAPQNLNGRTALQAVPPLLEKNSTVYVVPPTKPAVEKKSEEPDLKSTVEPESTKTEVVKPKSKLNHYEDHVTAAWKRMTASMRDSSAGEIQLRVLKLLKEKGQLTSTQLALELGLKNKRGISGIISGVFKNIYRFGFKHGSVIRRTQQGSGKSRTIVYRAASVLLKNDVLAEITEEQEI